MKQKTINSEVSLAGSAFLLGLFLFIHIGEAKAHVEVCPTGFGGTVPCASAHNSNVRHLAGTAFSACVWLFGKDTCNDARSASSAISQGAQDVVDAAVECTTSFDAAGNCITAGSDTVTGSVDQVVSGVGLTPELLAIAVLKGTVTMEAILNGATPIDQNISLMVMPEPVEPAPSPACSAAIFAMPKRYPVQQGAPYSIPVSACAEITYVLTPEHPLYSWSPPSRRVTVGAVTQKNKSGYGRQIDDVSGSSGRASALGRGDFTSKQANDTAIMKRRTGSQDFRFQLPAAGKPKAERR
jgi:hypothetical protein